MKKKFIILISLVLIIFMITLLSRPKTKPTPLPPSPTPSAKNQFNLNGLSPTESTQLIQDSLKYGQAIKELNQKYPWYSQLPIETKDFRIVYDFDKNSFRIRLLTQASETIKQAAVDKLKEIGVDLNKFSYYFLEN